MSPLHGYRVRAESDAVETDSSGSGHGVWAHGPCLYMGPQGQRCERPALEGGFCEHHTTDAVAVGPWPWVRRLAGILVAMAILWPIIEAFLNELSRWRH